MVAFLPPSQFGCKSRPDQAACGATIIEDHAAFKEKITSLVEQI